MEKIKIFLFFLQKLFQVCLGETNLFVGSSNCSWNAQLSITENYCDGSSSKPFPNIPSAWLSLSSLEVWNKSEDYVLLLRDKSNNVESDFFSQNLGQLSSLPFNISLKSLTIKPESPGAANILISNASFTIFPSSLLAFRDLSLLFDSKLKNFSLITLESHKATTINFTNCAIRNLDQAWPSNWSLISRNNIIGAVHIEFYNVSLIITSRMPSLIDCSRSTGSAEVKILFKFFSLTLVNSKPFSPSSSEFSADLFWLKQADLVFINSLFNFSGSLLFELPKSLIRAEANTSLKMHNSTFKFGSNFLIKAPFDFLVLILNIQGENCSLVINTLSILGSLQLTGRKDQGLAFAFFSSSQKSVLSIVALSLMNFTIARATANSANLLFTLTFFVLANDSVAMVQNASISSFSNSEKSMELYFFRISNNVTLSLKNILFVQLYVTAASIILNGTDFNSIKSYDLTIYDWNCKEFRNRIFQLNNLNSLFINSSKFSNFNLMNSSAILVTFGEGNLFFLNNSEIKDFQTSRNNAILYFNSSNFVIMQNFVCSNIFYKAISFWTSFVKAMNPLYWGSYFNVIHLKDGLLRSFSFDTPSIGAVRTSNSLIMQNLWIEDIEKYMFQNGDNSSLIVFNVTLKIKYAVTTIRFVQYMTDGLDAFIYTQNLSIVNYDIDSSQRPYISLFSFSSTRAFNLSMYMFSLFSKNNTIQLIGDHEVERMLFLIQDSQFINITSLDSFYFLKLTPKRAYIYLDRNEINGVQIDGLSERFEIIFFNLPQLEFVKRLAADVIIVKNSKFSHVNAPKGIITLTDFPIKDIFGFNCIFVFESNIIFNVSSTSSQASVISVKELSGLFYVNNCKISESNSKFGVFSFESYYSPFFNSTQYYIHRTFVQFSKSYSTGLFLYGFPLGEWEWFSKKVFVIKTFVINIGENFIDLIVFDCEFSEIETKGKGGLVFSAVKSRVAIYNSRLINIKCFNSGSAFYFSSQTLALVFNITITNCETFSRGGGVFNLDFKNNVTLEQATVKSCDDVVILISQDENLITLRNVTVIIGKAMTQKDVVLVTSEYNKLFFERVNLKGLQQTLNYLVNFFADSGSLQIIDLSIMIAFRKVFVLSGMIEYFKLRRISYFYFSQLLTIYKPDKDIRPDFNKSIFELEEVTLYMNSNLISIIESNFTAFIRVVRSLIFIRPSSVAPFVIIPSASQPNISVTNISLLFFKVDFLRDDKTREFARISSRDQKSALIIFREQSESLVITNCYFRLGDSLYSNIIYSRCLRNLNITQTIFFYNRLNFQEPFSSLIYFETPFLFEFISINLELIDVSFNSANNGLVLFLLERANANKKGNVFVSIMNSTVQRNKARGLGPVLFIQKPEESVSQVQIRIRFSEFFENEANAGSFLGTNELTPNVIPFPPLESFLKFNSLVNTKKMRSNRIIKSASKYLSIFRSINDVDIFVQNKEDEAFSIKNKDPLLHDVAPSENLPFFIKHEEGKNKSVGFLLSDVRNREIFPACYFVLVPFDSLGYVMLESRDFSAEGDLYYDLNDIRIYFENKRGTYCANKFEIIKPLDIINQYYRLNIDKTLAEKLFGLRQDLAKQIALELVIKFTPCEKGSLFSAQTLDCAPCEKNTYSDKEHLDSFLSCIKCLDRDIFNCYGGNLRSPKRDFWRKDSETDRFLRCPHSSCLGDVYFEKNISSKDCLNCSFRSSIMKINSIYVFDGNFTATGKCLLGYRGVMCTECEEGLGKSGHFKCSDCSSRNLMFQFVFSGILKIILLYFSIWKALNFDMLSEKSIDDETNSNVEKSYLLKILFQFITYISLLNSIPNNFSEAAKDLFITGGNIAPSEEYNTFSFQCLQRELFGDRPVVYTQLLILLVFYSSTCLLFILLLAAKALKTSKGQRMSFRLVLKTFKENWVRIYLLVFMENITAFLAPYFEMFLCININSYDKAEKDQRLLRDLSQFCWQSSHKYLTFALALPLFVLVGLMTPIYVFLKVFRAVSLNKTKDKQFLQTFAFFVYPYGEKRKYFDSVVTLRKLFFICFKGLFVFFIIQNETNFILMMFTLYLMTFYLIQKISVPYDLNNFKVLQKVEINALQVSISNAIIALIWNLASNEMTEYLKISILLYLLVSNIFFCVFWLIKYFVYLRANLFRFLVIYSRIMKKPPTNFTLRAKTHKYLTVKDLLEKEIENLKNEKLELIKTIKMMKARMRKIWAEKAINDPAAGCEKAGSERAGSEQAGSEQAGSEKADRKIAGIGATTTQEAFRMNPPEGNQKILFEKPSQKVFDGESSPSVSEDDLNKENSDLQLISSQLKGHDSEDAFIHLKYKVSGMERITKVDCEQSTWIAVLLSESKGFVEIGVRPVNRLFSFAQNYSLSLKISSDSVALRINFKATPSNVFEFVKIELLERIPDFSQMTAYHRIQLLGNEPESAGQKFSSLLLAQAELNAPFHDARHQIYVEIRKNEKGMGFKATLFSMEELEENLSKWIVQRILEG